MMGSFANVCILRLPRTISPYGFRVPIVRAADIRSKPVHNIPVISYLFLKGRCAYCRAPISMQYPLDRSRHGLFFLFNAWHFSDF